MDVINRGRVVLAGLLLVWTGLQPAGTVVLDNEYVRVTRGGASCASGRTPGCGDRVIVALGDTELRAGGARRRLVRGDIAVFAPGDTYDPPTGGPFLEVAIKPTHPAVTPPKERLPPEKNALKYDGDRFFVFEERLEPGETRARHGHGPRVVVQLNRTRLQQWPDGEPEVLRDIVPDGAAFNAPVIHIVKNVGQLPLRGIVIEFKPGNAS
jgi:hypothetical protein